MGVSLRVSRVDHQGLRGEEEKGRLVSRGYGQVCPRGYAHPPEPGIKYTGMSYVGGRHLASNQAGSYEHDEYRK